MASSKHARAIRHLKWDLAVLFISMIVALVLLRTGASSHLISVAQSYQLIGAFVAGIFFTSMFTVGISTVALVELGNSTNVLPLSLAAALGAVFGDMLLFFFIRDTLAEDLREVLKTSNYKKLVAHFHGGVFRWLSPILGALVIATPLPDELGIALMGMAKMRSAYMIPITFVMNFAGIYGILAIATHL